MKVVSIVAAVLSLALIALTLVPQAGVYRPYLSLGAVVCAAAVLFTIIAAWRASPAPAAFAPAAPPVPAAPPMPVAIDGSLPGASNGSPRGARRTAEADVVLFLASLQEKGRLVDFLQDDIAGYSDAQVGAAARVVHQGCRAVLDEYLRIIPVRPENEGARVTIDADYAPDEYRLVGRINGDAPFSGTLMHRGWKAQSVHLPRVLDDRSERLPTIAPAEVELR